MDREEPTQASDFMETLEFSDQIGYRTVTRNGEERLEPINREQQAIFEAALWKLRQK
ncbi:MAG: hypothetical protein WDN31_02485 [Hyphomicrobium sp.]